MKKIRIKEFGGHRRVLPKEVGISTHDGFDEFLATIPDIQYDRLTDDQRQIVDILRRGLSTLSDMQQRVILTLVDHRCSERQAAEILGIHYGTFQNHLTRARKKLLQYVKDVGQKADLGILSEGTKDDAEKDDNDVGIGDQGC